MNSFGTLFRFTSFGESHGPAIGGIIDGMPAGIPIDLDLLRKRMEERRPGASSLTSRRREADNVELLSGIYEGRSLGSPIGFIIRNTDCRSDHYSAIQHAFRPGHADMTYFLKYGRRDPRGGGRASARETACRVVAGAFAEMALNQRNISIEARMESVGGVSSPDDIKALLEQLGKSGDSTGGIVAGSIIGLPPGLGEPLYRKFSAMLADAMLSINAAKGFEFGSGFDGTMRRGSEAVDEWTLDDNGCPITRSNFSGGIQGGITNGMPVEFRVAFKPIATLPGHRVMTLSDDMKPTAITVTGRHDPCALPRAVPVVRAMAACVALDALLLDNAPRGLF